MRIRIHRLDQVEMYSLSHITIDISQIKYMFTKISFNIPYLPRPFRFRNSQKTAAMSKVPPPPQFTNIDFTSLQSLPKPLPLALFSYDSEIQPYDQSGNQVEARPDAWSTRPRSHPRYSRQQKLQKQRKALVT